MLFRSIRPVEVVCWGDTQVHPIESEDHAIGLVRYENGAIGQFEVSWSFRGGMDLRDEVVGTEGTIWLNHWLRTGIEIFSSVGSQEYVAEKSESSKGWMFPVGNETSALGYLDMFEDMLNSYDANTAPRETFFDGYVVNSIVDAAYRSIKSKRWEPIQLDCWIHSEPICESQISPQSTDIIKRERLPDGTERIIYKNASTGEIENR